MTAATADAGWLRLYLLEIDGTPVAAVFTFAADGRLLVYNSGYDPAYRACQRRDGAGRHDDRGRGASWA